MSIFKPVTLAFNNNKYTIPADQIMSCLAQIEDIITLQDLTNKNRVPLARLAQAYGVALRFTGASITDEQIYETVFEPAGKGLVQVAISGLLSMMIPPSKFQHALEATEEKKSRAAKRKTKN